MQSRPKFESIDDYLAALPNSQKEILEIVRTTVGKMAPTASQAISYGIPTFKIDGHPLIYFAGYKSHIGIYPVTKAVKEKLGKQIAPYEAGKGTLRFSLTQPFPYKLIEKIVMVRLSEIKK